MHYRSICWRFIPRLHPNMTLNAQSVQERCTKTTRASGFIRKWFMRAGCGIVTSALQASGGQTGFRITWKVLMEPGDINVISVRRGTSQGRAWRATRHLHIQITSTHVKCVARLSLRNPTLRLTSGTFIWENATPVLLVVHPTTNPVLWRLT